MRNCWTESLTGWVGFGLLLLGMASLAPRARAQGFEASDLAGRWRVVERGLGLATRLDRIEISPPDFRGRALISASDDKGGRLGSARLDDRGDEPPIARWLRAEWTSGGWAWSLQLRPAGRNRLVAMVRELPRSRTGEVGERVRQVILAREEGRIDDPAPPARMPAGRRPNPLAPVPGDLAGLFVVRADGSGLRAVAVPDGFIRAAQPAWSPDGSQLAFVGFDASGRDPLIRVVPVQGGATVAVAAGTAPAWSRDGRRLAFVASGKPPFATDWSTPGRNDERVAVLELAGPDAGSVALLGRGLWPRWSPTDDRLAFVARSDANWDVYVRSEDGLALTRLTDDPALDTRPVWTRDGRAIVFLSDRGNRWDLYRAESGGPGRATRLTNHRHREDGADLSPDGRAVLFAERSGRPESRILRLDLETGVARPLLGGSFGDDDPAWSRDGRFVAFVSRRPLPLPAGLP